MTESYRLESTFCRPIEIIVIKNNNSIGIILVYCRLWKLFLTVITCDYYMLYLFSAAYITIILLQGVVYIMKYFKLSDWIAESFSPE